MVGTNGHKIGHVEYLTIRFFLGGTLQQSNGGMENSQKRCPIET